MATDPRDEKLDDQTIVRGGLSFHVARRLGFEPPNLPRRRRKVLLLMLVTWVPLFLLSAVQGHAWGYQVDVSFLRDPVPYSRFLFVVPLLELAQVVMETSLGVQMRHFFESGLVPDRQRLSFDAARLEVIRLRGSVVAEAVIIVLSITICVVGRIYLRLDKIDSSWARSGSHITPAGWWYILVSLPILGFFLLRWLWIYLLWGWFLFRVSRLDLELTPTHPDRAGGLGFLAWTLVSYSPVLMAVSAVLSGSFAHEIIHKGASLDSLKYHALVFVVLALVILHLPLLFFSGRQIRSRFRALLDFGTLIRRHDRAFDEKWIRPLATSRDTLLGSPDVASQSDIATIFEHVDRMQIIAFDRKALVVLVVAAVAPMVPLLGTLIPLKEILKMLGEFMV